MNTTNLNILTKLKIKDLFPYALFILILIVSSIYITGCGGSNNPNGPTDQLLTSSQTGIATDTVDYGSLAVQLVDASYNSAISHTNANITVQLYQGTNVVAQSNSINNQLFYFDKLNQGIYTIKVIDSNNIYKTTYALADIKANQTTNVTVNIFRNPDTSIETVNIIGKVVDSLNKVPIMFAVVELYTQDQTTIPFRTITSGSGYFMFEKVTSGTWVIKVSKSNYYDLTETITVQNKNSIILKSQTITSTTTINNANADGSSITGYKIPDLELTAKTTITGGIYGRIKDPVTNNYLASSVLLELYYCNNRSEEEKPKKVYFGFTTNDQGYLHLINLEPGYYTIAKINSSITSVVNPVSGRITYSITPAPLVEFIKVDAGKTTELPTSGFDR